MKLMCGKMEAALRGIDHLLTSSSSWRIEVKHECLIAARMEPMLVQPKLSKNFNKKALQNIIDG